MTAREHNSAIHILHRWNIKNGQDFDEHYANTAMCEKPTRTSDERYAAWCRESIPGGKMISANVVGKYRAFRALLDKELSYMSEERHEMWLLVKYLKVDADDAKESSGRYYRLMEKHRKAALLWHSSLKVTAFVCFAFPLSVALGTVPFLGVTWGSVAVLSLALPIMTFVAVAVYIAETRAKENASSTSV